MIRNGGTPPGRFRVPAEAKCGETRCAALGPSCTDLSLAYQMSMETRSKRTKQKECIMKAEISNPHDRFFKSLFSREEVSRDFFINYLPPDIVSLIDPDSAELVKDSFVDQELGEFFSDMLYKVRLRDGGTAYIHILLEHKSYSDPLAGFQMLCYMVRIWEKAVRRHMAESKARRKAGKKSPPGGKPLRLPHVIPVLICHGRFPWNVPRDFRSLFPPRPDLDAHTPDFTYLVCDLSRHSDEEIRGMVILKAGMLLMKHIFSDDLGERLPEILGLLRELSAGRTGPEFLKTMMTYLSGGTDRINKDDLGKAVRSAFPEKGDTLMATIAEQWYQEGEARGEARGKAEGKVEGKAEGKLIGQILLAQRILRRETYSEEELEKKSSDELRAIFSEIESSLSV
ncbi:MAG: hypothetical protein B6245_21675 [Desulfobacteraceae bacterium 4572_88]|nr:MAG: hypothetical protein B6245_21675 [Desulfobacteraceae bacterium 4572_88]